MEKERWLSKLSFKGDKIILGLVVFLSMLSILLVYSTGGRRVVNHLVHLLFCYAGLAFFYVVNYKKVLEKGAFLGLLFAFLLVALTLTSRAVRGITFFGHDVQTFYLIGFLVIIFLSNFIGRRYNKEMELSEKDMKYLIVILLFFCACIASLNMSTAIILFGTGIVIFFVGKFKLKYIMGVVAVAVVVVGVLALVVMKSGEEGSHIGRMGTFVNRMEYYFTKENVNGYGDQMILARAAIARSGLHPAGPGKGVIKNRLPENATDYAFASLFEETGIILGLIVLMAYLVIFYRAWKISKNSPNALGAILSFGIGFWFTCQALVHIGVNCELLPTTGQTLPFISSGGASLFVSGCAMGMLLNVSKKNEEPEEVYEDPKQMFYH
ncbi:MAG: FtsW/RodA/SpoVE family cell cycle protein [Bacteroidales bacterium]|nr:FtsW/RodA/SpoVE family cell cycle protein [Bacteroidales bacterium]